MQSLSSIPDHVAILIPTLNEEHHIGRCLDSLLAGVHDQKTVEILVLDGGSQDRTARIVKEYAAQDPRIRLIPNPARLQAAAINLGARLAAPDATIIIRADAHADYPADFIALCVQALRTHNATSVVVPMITRGLAPMQRAIAAAQNSRLGNGGSAHRRSGVSRFVEHGHHAAFDRAFFQQLGGYDERFTHNEDAELDLRAVQAGGRIWMCCEAAMTYFPRDSLFALARQYRKHGEGRARTVALHKQPPRLRQLAPVAALLGSLAGIILSFWQPVFLLLPIIYIALCLAGGAGVAVSRRDIACVLAGPAAIVMHLGWAAGFLIGLVRFSGITPRATSEPICISSS